MPRYHPHHNHQNENDNGNDNHNGTDTNLKIATEISRTQTCGQQTLDVRL